MKYGIVVMTTRATSLSWWAGSPSDRKSVLAWVRKIYSNPSYALEDIKQEQGLEFELRVVPVNKRVCSTFGGSPILLSKDKYLELPTHSPYAAPACLSEGREMLASYSERLFFSRRRPQAKIPAVTMVDWADDETEEKIDSFLSIANQFHTDSQESEGGIQS